MHEIEKSSEFKSGKYGSQFAKNRNQQPLVGFSGAGQCGIRQKAYFSPG
jgi:hypothetical protein